MEECNQFDGVLVRTVGQKDYELKHHLGNVRVLVSDRKEWQNGILSAAVRGYYHYYPFGMHMPQLFFPGNTTDNGGYRYGYNGQEKDDEVKGGGNSYDFGARLYDPRIGRWFSTDPLFKAYPSVSHYSYVSNNPIAKIDVGGKWEIEVHLFNDRGKFGYGIAIVKDKDGNEVFRFRVRAQGMKHKDNDKNPRDRLKRYSDTPTGTYSFEQWRSDGDREIYGANARLDMIGTEGEIMNGTPKRDEIQIHGGRQEELVNGKWQAKADATLWNTGGCLRVWDADIETLKGHTDRLELGDPLELLNRNIAVSNDLMEYKGKYFVQSEYNMLTEKETILQGLLDFKKNYVSSGNSETDSVVMENVDTQISNTQKEITNLESKGIK